MAITGAEVWRDYETDGVPSSGAHKVKKSDARSWAAWVEGLITAFTSNGGLIFTLKSNMDSVLTHDPATMAWVIGDPVTANNGVYQKLGASGTGSWVRRADLPYSFIIASDAGAGTPNAIQATTSIPVSGSALIWMNVFEANTASPVTVSFNGDPPLTIKTNAGNDVAVGGLTAGMIVMGIVSGSTFRLVSDQASAAVLAAAEAFANAAAASAADAEAAAIAAGNGSIFPELMASWNASDAAPAIEEAAAISVSSGAQVKLTAGKVYTVSQLALPSNTRLSAFGATIRCLGGLSVAADRDVSIGENCHIDELVLSRPNSGTNEYWLEIGDGTWIDYLSQEADEQWAKNGVITSGQDVHIGFYSGINVERVFDTMNLASAQSTNFYLGGFRIRNYRRGLYLSRQKNFYIGDFDVDGRSPLDAGVAAGQNSILIGGSSNGVIGDGYLRKSGEHAVRFGGDEFFDNEDIQVGDVLVESPRGCAFKINPSGFVGGRSKRIKAGHIMAVDTGEGPTSNNQELVRISHAYGVDIDSVSGLVDVQPESGQYAVLLNDCNFVRIGSIRGAFNAGIRIDETADVDGITTFGGNVANVTIENFTGTIGAFGNAVSVSMPNFAIGNIKVSGIDISGFTSRFADMDVGSYSGKVYFEGIIRGTVAPAFAFVTTTNPGDNVQVDFAWDTGRYIGRASAMAFSTKAALQITTPSFNPGNVTPTGIFINCSQGTGGLGTFGGSFDFGRVGSLLRGASIALEQTGASSFNTGLGFYTAGTGGASSNDVRKVGLWDHFGNLAFQLANTGIVLVAPDGTTRRRLTIDNAGALVLTAV